MTLKEMSIDQLLQRLKDAEDEVAFIKLEIDARYRAEHPKLFDAVRKATRKALNAPSWMERNYIGYLSPDDPRIKHTKE